MFLVDNFKTFLLVGLICTAGFSPSYAATCKNANGGDMTCDAMTECKIDSMGKAGGCVGDSECPDGKPGGEITCNKAGCCCTAKDTSCNDPMMETIKTAICSETGPNPPSMCAVSQSSGSGNNSAGAGTDGNNDGTGDMFSCRLLNGTEGSVIKNLSCSIDKYCTRTSNNTPPLLVCSPDGCNNDKEICCQVPNGTTCEIGGGSAVFGSLQLVTFLATVLYFIPIKLAS